MPGRLRKMLRRSHRLSPLLLPMLMLAGLASPLLLASPALARTLEVGPTRELKAPSAAAAVAQDGDKILIDAGEYFDCAIWKQNDITIEGVGPNASAVITDKTCQGKALFVIHAKNVTVRNLTLQRARVPDKNGAGIRQEGPGLVVEKVKFINNENGILAGAIGGSMTIRDSEFIKNGSCDGACAHGVYVNDMDLLRIERCKFIDTRHAHHIKSRAKVTEVLDSTIEDGPDGTASYEIEVPNGGSVLIRGNTIQKGPKAENHTAMIVIGSEGVKQPTPRILIENNTATNTGSYDTFFVWNLTATEAMLKNNKLSGPMKPLRGDGEVH